MTHPVSMGEVDNRGATTAPGSLTFFHGPAARNVGDNAPRNEGSVRQTAQRAGPARANTARRCEQ
jgi:hypothetical protein